MAIFKQKMLFELFCNATYNNILELPLFNYEEYNEIVDRSLLSLEEYTKILQELPYYRCVLSSFEIIRLINTDELKQVDKIGLDLRMAEQFAKAIRSLDREEQILHEFELRFAYDLASLQNSEMKDKYNINSYTSFIVGDLCKKILINISKTYNDKYNEIFRYIYVESEQIRKLIDNELKQVAIIDVSYQNNLDDQTITFQFEIGTKYSYITTGFEHKIEKLSDQILISMLISFLARYFYIADKRQVFVAKSYLLNLFNKSKDRITFIDSNYSTELLESILATFNQDELKAVDTLSEGYELPSKLWAMLGESKSLLDLRSAVTYVLKLKIYSSYGTMNIFSKSMTKKNKTAFQLIFPVIKSYNILYLPILLKYMIEVTVGNVKDYDTFRQSVIDLLMSIDGQNFNQMKLVNKVLECNGII